MTASAAGSNEFRCLKVETDLDRDETKGGEPSDPTAVAAGAIWILDELSSWLPKRVELDWRSRLVANRLVAVQHCGDLGNH